MTRHQGRFASPGRAEPAPLLTPRASEASRLASALARIGAAQRREAMSARNWRVIAALRAEIAAERVLF